DTVNFCERSEVSQRYRPHFVPPELGISLPGDADTEAVAWKFVTPALAELRIGKQIRHVMGNRRERRLERPGQTHERDFRSSRRCWVGAGEELIDARRAAEERDKPRRTADADFAGS